MNTQGTYVGDTGAVITLDCGTDVRAATARNIEARVRNSLGKLGPSVFIAHTVGGAASINTPEIAPEAATEIFTDTYNFSGTGYGSTTARTVNFTPSADCRIEVSATLADLQAQIDTENDRLAAIAAATTEAEVEAAMTGAP